MARVRCSDGNEMHDYWSDCGAAFRVHDTAIVEQDAIVGDNTVIWHLCHVRKGARIGHSCSLGRNVYVENGAWLGDYVRVQNNVSIYDGVTIGHNSFIGPSVVFTNDRYPRAGNRLWTREETNIGEHVSIGAGAVILCGIRIGNYAMIGAGAVVTKDVNEFELIVGRNERAGYVDENGRPRNA